MVHRGTRSVALSVQTLSQGNTARSHTISIFYLLSVGVFVFVKLGLLIMAAAALVSQSDKL